MMDHQSCGQDRLSYSFNLKTMFQPIICCVVSTGFLTFVIRANRNRPPRLAPSAEPESGSFMVAIRKMLFE